METDHYAVLGLPSGEDGSKLTDKEISKAYKLKALELHPDKRPDDPKAHENFQKLKLSYDILNDEKTRKNFDDFLRVKRERELRQYQFDLKWRRMVSDLERQRRQYQFDLKRRRMVSALEEREREIRRQYQSDSKRCRMVSDLEERKRASFAPYGSTKARGEDEEQRIARKLREEIAQIRAMHANKRAPASSASAPPKREMPGVGKEGGGGMEKKKVLKVLWEKAGLDYTAEILREIFSKFGEVEDVVIRASKKKGSALVVMSSRDAIVNVMASRDAVIAATGSVCGDLSNPLLVLPLQPVKPVAPFAQDFSSVKTPLESVSISKLVSPVYQAFKDYVLEKLRKAAAKQKRSDQVQLLSSRM